MDGARYTRAAKEWHWQIETPLKSILEETPEHTAKHPDWLELAAPTTTFAPQRSFLSVVILSRDEQQYVASSIEHLSVELRLHNVPHEIIVVDDGSSDKTWEILTTLRSKLSELCPVQNTSQHGFGRAVVRGLDEMKGDAVVIMMADESDDCRDVVRYWQKLNERYECVFGSRFMKGGGVIDYPRVKLIGIDWPISS